MLEGEKQVSMAPGAFVLGMLVGAALMWFGCAHYWRVDDRSSNAEFHCRAALVACSDAAVAAKACK